MARFFSFQWWTLEGALSLSCAADQAFTEALLHAALARREPTSACSKQAMSTPWLPCCAVADRSSMATLQIRTKAKRPLCSAPCRFRSKFFEARDNARNLVVRRLPACALYIGISWQRPGARAASDGDVLRSTPRRPSPEPHMRFRRMQRGLYKQ